MRAATMLKKKPFTPFLQGEGVHQKRVVQFTHFSIEQSVRREQKPSEI
jgi:hypothetical protein